MTWVQVPIWSLYRRVDKTGRPDLPLLSVYRDHGVVLRKGRDDNYNKPGADLSRYKIVSKGDLVINKMKTWQGSLGVSAFSGIVSPAYFVASRIGEVDDRFMHHLLRSRPLIAEYAARSKGIRPAQWDLPWYEFASIKVQLPNVATQRAIADYLDTETSRIDTLITKKRRMIARLEERWIAHVASVLTRFDPVPLKRFVTKIGSGSTPRGGADVYVPRGPAFLRSQNIQKGVVDLSDVVFIDRVAQDELRRALVHTGDVLLNITGGSIGRAAVFDRSDIQAFVSQHVCIVRPAPGVDAGVLCAELSSHSVQDQISVTQVGGNRPGLNFEQVGNLLVRVPPSDQSQAIAQELASAVSCSVRTSETVGAQIDLLRERRQALITAAIAGELPVP